MESKIHLPYSKKELILPGTLFYEHQISVTGGTASGKSALVRLLKAELMKRRNPGDPEYEEHSAGEFKRKLALEPRPGYPNGFREPDGVSPDMVAFTRWERENPKFNFDELCDRATLEFSKRDFRICDGRLAHIFMLSAFKITIICNATIRAKRRAKQAGLSQLQAISKINDRDHNDRVRYQEKYPGWDWHLDDYDCVIVNEAIPESQLPILALKDYDRWLVKMSDRFIPKDRLASKTGLIRTSVPARA